MEVGKRYVVTNASTDGTFEVGDHIHMYENGDVGCREGRGWIDAIDVPEASAGMEVAIDPEWIEQRKRNLREELAAMEGISNAD